MSKSILLIILCLCAPAIADTAVLIYTVNQQVNPWLMSSDMSDLTAGGIKANFKMSAALIFAVDTRTLKTVVPSPAQSPVFVLLGKDADGTKLNYILTGDINSVNLVKKINLRTESSFVSATWSFGDVNWSTSITGSAGAYGPVTWAVIAKGSSVRVGVPLILKGTGTLQKDCNDPLYRAGIGDGDVSAVLNLNLTRLVNAAGNGTVQAAVALVERRLPPSPNPLTWVTPPFQYISGGSCFHSMACCDVLDPNPPILYRFVCVDNSTLSSQWQESTSYTVNVGSTHSYRWYVLAKDGYGNTTSKGNAVWVR